MRLAQRLLLGTVALVALLVVAIATIAGERLRERLNDQQARELLREARLVGTEWGPGDDADTVADRAGGALGFRVTLIDVHGVVQGDSEFDEPALGALENHGTRPEVQAAVAGGQGTATRASPSAGDEELYAAVRHPLGVVRVSLSTAQVARIVDGAQRDVFMAGAFAFIGALVLAWFFARSVSRPVVELRDVAMRIAAGDLAARPAMAAPGEVGDLATALHLMAEQLGRRLTAMREDDARLTAIVESLNEGVLALSPRGDVVRMNERARHLLRLREATPFGVDQLPRSTVLREMIDDALAGTATEPTEAQLFGNTLAVTARPLDAGGAVVALFDLTPMRRLEMMRSDFVANVSHELKTPLTVVRGFAETLVDDDVPAADRHRFSAAIAANAERMQRIVDDLLDLSRIETGGWVPAPSWNDMTTVVAEAFAAAQPAAQAKGLSLAAAVDAERVYADPTALRQVVGNLVENAVRYTVAGDVTVTARRDGDQVVVAVRDTGVGIGAEHLPRIFERFYRADRARTRAEGGTGLGLAIVKHLVDAHGGRVRADSVEGHGTTVTVTFPDPDGLVRR